MPANTGLQIGRRCAAFLANVLAAFIGTAVLESPISPLVKVFAHSAASMVIREWICSIALAALIGFLAQRRWKTNSARWVWVAGVLWFAFGLTQFGDPWLTFSGIRCAEFRGYPCVAFWSFTVPLIRTIAYSIAAFLTARLSGDVPAEFHPALSHFFSAMFLTGLPKIDKERSVVEETSSTSPNDPDQKQRMHGN
jgi:hypothetical protein